MRCVNETLPPRARLRWLLMTIRLSISSFAGTARTLVAVGIVRLASMLATTRAAGPLSWTVSGPLTEACTGVAAFGLAGGGSAGVGLATAALLETPEVTIGWLD